jgi:hypothetical protein
VEWTFCNMSAGTEKNHVTKHVCGAVVRILSWESRSDVARSGVDRTKGTRLLVEFVVCEMFGVV